MKQGLAHLQPAALAAEPRTRMFLKRTVFGPRPAVSSLASGPRVGGGPTFRWAHCAAPASLLWSNTLMERAVASSRTVLDSLSAAHAMARARIAQNIAIGGAECDKRSLTRPPGRAMLSVATHSRLRREAIGSDGDSTPPSLS